MERFGVRIGWLMLLGVAACGGTNGGDDDNHAAMTLQSQLIGLDADEVAPQLLLAGAHAGSLVDLEEAQWLLLEPGSLVQVRLLDGPRDALVDVRVNMRKYADGARVLGGTINNQANSSLFVRWSKTSYRAVLTLADEDLGYLFEKASGAPLRVKRNKLDRVVCKGLPHMPLDPAVPAPVGARVAQVAANLPILNSNPGAASVILLDFDGHLVSGTLWNSSYNGGQDIVAEPFSLDSSPDFNEQEVERIRTAFTEVAEDFAPFTINVTTDEAVYQSAPETSRVRVIITPTNYFLPGWGGYAYYFTFRWEGDTPVWVWNQTLYSMGVTSSHEVGHAVGLTHDGTPSAVYYNGHNAGDNVYWGAIMGAFFGGGINHWSRGEYPNANNQQDDLAEMVGEEGSGYGFTYRADDAADDLAQAGPLSVVGTETIGSQSFDRVRTTGIISKRNDVDVYTFVTQAAGAASLLVQGVGDFGNLDVEATLLDASGAVLQVNNPAASLSAELVFNAQAGQRYFVRIDGVGKGMAQTYGYSDYSSLGSYTITGLVPSSAPPGNSFRRIPVLSANLLIEAESPDNAALLAPLERQTDPAAFGHAYIAWPEAGQEILQPNDLERGVAQYSFDLASSKNVTLWARVNFPNNGSNSFFYKLEGATDWLTVNAPLTNGWRWVPLQGVSELAHGVHTLKVLRREDGTKLDALFLSVEGEPPPATDPGLTLAALTSNVLFEAEAAARTSAVAPLSVFIDSEASRGGYVAWPEAGQIRQTPSDTDPGQLAFSAYKTQPGPVAVYARVKFPDNGSNSFFYKLEGMGGWTFNSGPGLTNGWQWILLGEYNVPTEGTVSLKVLKREDGAMIDAVMFSVDGVPPEQTGLLAPRLSSTLVLQAEDHDNVSAFSPFMAFSDTNALMGAYIEWPNSGQEVLVANDTDEGQSHVSFDLRTSSTIALQARVHFPNNGSNSFFYKLEGVTEWLTVNGPGLTSGWQWVTLPSIASVPAGTVTLKILKREDGTKLDAFSLSATPL